MRQIQLSDQDRKDLVISIKKIIGQLQNISNLVENDQVTDQTFTQLLAIKGGVNRVCKEIITRGVLKKIHEFEHQELDHALNIIFKLD